MDEFNRSDIEQEAVPNEKQMEESTGISKDVSHSRLQNKGDLKNI